MAIPFLNHLDLRSVSELQNAILHKTTHTSATNKPGAIIYDTGDNVIKFCTGTTNNDWITLGGDTVRTIKVDTTNNGTADATLETSESLQLIGGTNITLAESGGVVTINAGAATTVGKTNSTQRSGSIELIAGTNVTITEDGTTGHFTFSSTDTNTQLSTEEVQDIAGPLVASGGTKTGITITYQDSTNDMDFVVSDLTVAGDSGSTGMTPGDTLTIAGGTNVSTSMSGDTLTITSTDTNTDVDVSKANLLTRLASFDSGDTVHIGDADDDTTVVIRGTLQVDGTTTTVNSETLTIDDNKIVLNDNVTGTPTEDAGLVIERGNQTNTELRWNESDDDWEYTAFNHAGTPALTTYKIPTTFKGAVGDSSASAGSYSEAVTHNLGSRDVIVQLYDTSSYETVHADVVRTDANTVTLTFASAPTDDDVTVLISKVG